MFERALKSGILILVIVVYVWVKVQGVDAKSENDGSCTSMV